MATGTIYLRPSADIYVEHALTPSDSAYAYLLICEDVSDGNSTYICSTDTVTAPTSKFKLSSTNQIGNKPFIVNSVSIIGEAYTTQDAAGAKNEFALEINGIETEYVLTQTSKDVDISTQMSSAVGLINDFILTHGTLPDINIIVTSLTFDYTSGNKARSVNSGITQVYVAINYEEIPGIGVYKKVGEQWKEATAAYHKVGGAWVEITEEECKSILQNNTICSG